MEDIIVVPRVSIKRIPAIQSLFGKVDNYEVIKKDISERGIQTPLGISDSNELIRGYNRLAIADELQIETIPCIPKHYDSIGEMKIDAILDNLLRRQLTSLQIAEYGIVLEEAYRNRQGTRADLGKKLPEVGRTRDLVVAKIKEKTGTKMSGKKYELLKNIVTKAAPAVKQKLNESEITQQAALEIIKLDDHAEQLSILNEYSNTKEIKKAVAKKEQSVAKSKRLKPKLDRLKELVEEGIYIGSLWAFGKRKQYAGESDFHGNAPPQIVENAILLYTNEGDVVLDPMAGSGTVLDVCEATGRKCRAFDLTPQRDDIEAQNAYNMGKVADNSIDFIFWHPPYWQLVKYSDKEEDLSQMTWEDFLGSVTKVLSECHRVLKQNKYMCILSGDCVKEGTFYPISRRIANAADSYFTACGIAIKTTQGATSQIIKGKTIWAELAVTDNLKIEHDFVLIFRR